jgi:hypothetical protein
MFDRGDADEGAPFGRSARRKTMTAMELAAQEVINLYDELQQVGLRALERLRSSDPEIADELLATFETADASAEWLASRTIGFGGECALDLLATGRRDYVLHILHHLRYGLCT